MRSLLITLAATASAIAVASPASAQWAPPVPQGYAYGYHDNYGQVRRLQARVDQLRRSIYQLDRRNRLTSREARRLDWAAVDLQRRIEAASFRGLTRRERLSIERRIDGLRQAIRSEARDGRRGWNGRDWRDDRDGYYRARHRDHDRRHHRDDDDDDDDDRDDRGDGGRDRDDD